MKSKIQLLYILSCLLSIYNELYPMHEDMLQDLCKEIAHDIQRVEHILPSELKNQEAKASVTSVIKKPGLGDKYFGNWHKELNEILSQETLSENDKQNPRLMELLEYKINHYIKRKDVEKLHILYDRCSALKIIISREQRIKMWEFFDLQKDTYFHALTHTLGTNARQFVQTFKNSEKYYDSTISDIENKIEILQDQTIKLQEEKTQQLHKVKDIYKEKIKHEYADTADYLKSLKRYKYALYQTINTIPDNEKLCDAKKIICLSDDERIGYSDEYILIKSTNDDDIRTLIWKCILGNLDEDESLFNNQEFDNS